MRIKIDENLPGALADALSELGHKVDTILSEGLKGMPDHNVFDAARREGRFLITQDLDFSDIRRFEPGKHPGILLVRLGSPGRDSLLHRIRSVFEVEDISSWPGCFVVVTDHKVRIRRPAGST